MGRLPREHRHYQVQALQERHHQMLRLALLGKTSSQIAEILGITPKNVSDVLNSPLSRDKLAVMRVAADCKSIDIAHFLMEEAPKSLEFLKKVRDGSPEIVSALGEAPQIPLAQRMHAAESLLDRHGTSRIQNIHALVGTAVITDEILADIKRKAAEARERVRSSGALEEAEVVPVREAI